MTIDEFIKELESKAELEKERAFYDAVKWNCITAYGSYCRKLESEYHQLAEWLKELKAHREAWEKVYRDIEQLTTILYESSCEGDWQYGIDKYDALDIIDKYRPKEGDAE